MTDWTVLCLFGGGAIFAAFSARLPRGRALWPLLSAVCTAAGVLAGLVLGWTLRELLLPVLLVYAVSMAALLYGKGDGA